METIKSYLEGMFASLPNTPEVLRAKSELFQMMEDKYNDLIEDGKNDNEAVGIVISEFGNLDELAEDLGIKNVKDELQIIDCKMITKDEVNGFITAMRNKSLILGFGIFLCIVSVCWPAFLLKEIYGICGMFITIAAGVIAIVFSNASTAKWKYLFASPARLEYSANNYVIEERERGITGHSLRLAFGILLCVLCWMPAVFMDEVFRGRGFMGEGLPFVLLFIFVGLGVFFIVQTNVEFGAYEKLLGLNGEVKKGHGKKDIPNYNNKAVDVLMHVYWPTVTCIYLVWSFLTFQWHLTWIVWPVSSVIFGSLKMVFRDEEENEWTARK